MTARPRSCPALMICAPASGQGKTTLTAGLARLHARAGRKVRVFKCGPDFLDPFWLQMASNAPVHQIDLWMCGETDVRERLWRAAQDADLILIEGVMGLYDGNPSAADLAARFGVPIAVVIDASAMAGTFGALAFGLMHYRENLRWAGVLANRVASSGHADMLSASLKPPTRWLGAVMRDQGMVMPERHLGLTVASEIAEPLQLLDRAADALASTPLGQMGPDELQALATEFAAPVVAAPVAPLAGRNIAIARDRSFCFVYEANLDQLRGLGANLSFFSPLDGDALPACDALWLPGGYPELHGPALAARRDLAQQIAAHVAQGRPVWAECGGMMALFERLVSADGDVCPMWGLLKGEVRMQKRLAGLGMQQLALPSGCLRGHTFHYSTANSTAPVIARTARPNQNPSPESGEAVYGQGSLRASYFHAWFASAPHAAASLFLPEALA